MSLPVVPKKETPMLARIKGMADSTHAAITGGNQIDTDAIAALKEDACAERGFNKQYLAQLQEMYRLAESEEEKASIRLTMEKLADSEHALGDKVRDGLKQTQSDNKKYNLWIISGFFAVCGTAYKYRKPLLDLTKKICA